MSKAMMLIDMPKTCADCPCAGPGKSTNEIVCRTKGWIVATRDLKPSWCPLIFLDMPRMDSILEALNDPLKLHMDPIQYVNGK